MRIRLPQPAFSGLPSGLPVAVRIDANRNLPDLSGQLVHQNLTAGFKRGAVTKQQRPIRKAFPSLRATAGSTMPER